MPAYSYKARTRGGEKVEGVVEAPDRRGALLEIERRGQIPVSVAEPGATKNGPPARRNPLLQRHHAADRMKARDMLLFTTELSDLLASGMKLGQALNSLATRRTGGAGDAVVSDLRDRIMRGANLSDALAAHPDTFPNLYVSMIRAGEAGGALGEVLARLVRHFERAQETREKIIAALIYPVIVLVMGFGTLVFSMVYVIPSFEEVFSQMETGLPLPTLMLIGMSRWMVRYGLFVLAGLIIGLVLLSRAFKTPSGRLWRDGLLLRFPLLKGVVAAGIFSNFAQTLETLMANGVRVVQALGIIEKTVGNSVVAREIARARERVADGTTISGPLAASQVFPPMLTDMLSVGEQTGDMCGALRHIARRYDNELDRNLKILTAALEPILIVVVAVIVGFIAISILMAVFQLSSGLGA